MDPNSSVYKKAQRHYLKSSQTAPSTNQSAFRIQERLYKARFPRPSLDSVIDVSHYEAEDQGRGMLEPDEVQKAGWRLGFYDPAEVKPIKLSGSSSTRSRAFRITRIPGLVVIHRFLSDTEQKKLIISSLRDQSRHPNETNLDAHYTLPDEGLWPTWERAWCRSSYVEKTLTKESTEEDDAIIYPKRAPNFSPYVSTKRELVENAPASTDSFEEITSSPKLPPTPSTSLQPTPVSRLLYKMRWANLGRSYHWGTKSYDFSKKLAPFSSDIKEACQRAVKAVDWNDVWKDEVIEESEWGEEGVNWRHWADDYDPDAGIVNFYQTSDTLMGHVDRSELSAVTPLVSISLGNAAVFLIGGLTRDVEPIPILLRSGDVVIMSGPRCRRAYHGVPRILEGTLPLHLQGARESEANDDWAPFAAYMSTTRININVRQVFPKGFVVPSGTLPG